MTNKLVQNGLKVDDFVIVVVFFAVCVRNLLDLTTVFAVAAGLGQRIWISGSQPSGSDHGWTTSGSLMRGGIWRRKRSKLVEPLLLLLFRTRLSRPSGTGSDPGQPGFTFAQLEGEKLLNWIRLGQINDGRSGWLGTGRDERERGSWRSRALGLVLKSKECYFIDLSNITNTTNVTKARNCRDYYYRMCFGLDWNLMRHFWVSIPSNHFQRLWTRLVCCSVWRESAVWFPAERLCSRWWRSTGEDWPDSPSWDCHPGQRRKPVARQLRWTCSSSYSCEHRPCYFHLLTSPEG